METKKRQYDSEDEYSDSSTSSTRSNRFKKSPAIIKYPDNKENMTKPTAISNTIQVPPARQQTLGGKLPPIIPLKVAKVDTKHGESIEKKVDQLFKVYEENKQILMAVNEQLNANTQKLDSVIMKLDDTRARVDSLQMLSNAGVDNTFSKPDFIPMQTIEEVEKYESYEDTKRQQLKNYLSHFRVASSPYDNLKYFLKGDFIIKDEVLVNFNYFKWNKTKMNTLQGTKLDIDLYTIVLKNHPSYSFNQHTIDFQRALRAAYARVTKRNNEDEEEEEEEDGNDNLQDNGEKKKKKKTKNSKMVPRKNIDKYPESTS
ncbi:uncharacterized protein LOC123268912 isoform X1 [Cotesia glomerata]|uniref:uncharacterized protein LOC123268912 isoform X1 n=1 Tax=Cotesia glomerata TaxID=32391 RepID=UPI001D02495B|nr:uncharacterized protein LOC123268912 isoform X1 [Cotesia glomerata]